MQTVMLASTIVAAGQLVFVAGSWNVMIPVILMLFSFRMLIRKKAVKAEQTEENRDAGAGKEDLWASFFRKRRQRKSRCSRPAIGSLSSGGKERAPAFREWRIKRWRSIF
ncbi:hypothetical protein [Gallintestinimicrobium sp.]|uniref:hypothetical protein n=1 Tax=Gallintestinimicrobium sp. TaxID=2981655 RepID=UPI00399535C7